MPSVAAKFDTKEEIAKVIKHNKEAYVIPEEAKRKLGELEAGTKVRMD